MNNVLSAGNYFSHLWFYLYLMDISLIDHCLTNEIHFFWETYFSKELRVLENQSALFKKGAKKILLDALLRQRILHQDGKFFHAMGSTILKLSPLGMAPYRLHRIKLRGITGEPLNFDDSICVLQILPEDFGSVDTPLVQNKNNFVLDTFLDAFNETKNIFGNDIVFLDRERELQMASFWRDAESADNREVLWWVCSA